MVEKKMKNLKRVLERQLASAAKLRLEAKIRKDYLEGTYHTQHDLAIRYGVADSTICQCLKRIRAIIQEDFREDTIADFERRIKQLEDVQGKANLAWERSKENSEELRIQYVKVKCPDCKGTGMQEDGETWCEKCDGKGTVTDEVISRKVVGQAGDPRFLSLVNECTKEIARLKGHYPERGKKKDEPGGEEGDKHLHFHFEGKVDPEILIQMRRLRIQAEESKNGNGQVVDVTPIEEEKEKE